MKPTSKFGLIIFLVVDVILLALCLIQIFHPFFHFENIGMYNAGGPTASAQGRLIVTAVLAMLVVVVPVLGAAFFIMYKYRDGRNQAYEPDWGDRHGYLIYCWWLCVGLLILFLTILNFKSAHQIDPLQKIVSNKKPLTIQVVALNWKWLFIYPEQNIATVNYLEIPVGTPIHFELTADAPMNLFWIPGLGGQMAAMAGMSNNLNLIADKPGEYSGQESEINGDGYAGMNFKVDAVSDKDFSNWIKSVQQINTPLSQTNYESLAKPSQNTPPATYSPVSADLYNGIIGKYMQPKVKMDDD